MVDMNLCQVTYPRLKNRAPVEAERTSTAHSPEKMTCMPLPAAFPHRLTCTRALVSIEIEDL